MTEAKLKAASPQCRHANRIQVQSEPRGYTKRNLLSPLTFVPIITACSRDAPINK